MCGTFHFQIESGNWQLFTALDGAAPDCQKTWGWIKSLYSGYSVVAGGTQALSGSAVTLTWNEKEGGTQDPYYIFKWEGETDPDNAVPIDTVAAGDSLSVDTDVLPGVVYNYRVAAEDGETLVDLGVAQAGLHVIWESVGEQGYWSVEGILCHGNSMFVMFYGSGAYQMVKYDISNPQAPVEVTRRTSFPDDPEGFTIGDGGTRLFVATKTGLLILDATSTGGIPLMHALWGLASGSNWVGNPVFDKTFVYVACGEEGLKAVYVPSGETPAIKGTYSQEHGVYDFSMHHGLLYVWGWENGERVITVLRPVISSFPFPLSVTFESVGGTGIAGWPANLRTVGTSGGKTGRFAYGHLKPGLENAEGEGWIMDMIDPLRPEPLRAVYPEYSWVDADFDERYFYDAAYPAGPNPFNRSVSAYEIERAASYAQFATGDTLGDQSKKGYIASYGDHLMAFDEFWRNGTHNYQSRLRLRVFAKAHGCAPHPDLPVRLVPEGEAYKVGQEIGVSWRVGCLTGIVIDLMKDNSVAVAGMVSHSYGTMADYEGCARIMLPALSGQLENHTFTFRATASYKDNTQATFYSPSFRLEIGNTLEVSHDGTKPYTSIQAAINAAQSGDTILVAEGNYSEHLTLKSNVRVIAPQGAAITPTSAGAAVVAANLMHPPTLQGFWVQFVPGINETGVSVENCGISVSDADFHALTRAVRISNGFGEFTKCRFMGNGDPVAGGAVWLNSAASGTPTTFADCEFLQNNAGTRGGAVYISSEGTYDPTAPQAGFLRCVFQGNSAPEAATVRVGVNTRPTFDHCLFVANNTTSASAASIVGGLGGVGGAFTNCTFADNTGSAAYNVLHLEPMTAASAVTLDACLIANNPNSSALAAYGSQYETTRCNFFGNSPGDATWAGQGSENFSADPAFCGPGEYSVYSFSPCLPGVTVDALVGALGAACGPPATVELLTGLGGLDPDSLLFGCPAGDADSFVVHIDFDDAIVTRDIGAAEVTLAAPYAARGIWTAGSIVAGAPAAAPDFETTLGYKYISGTGVDSLEIQVNGYPLLMKPVLERRGPDLNGDGKININDFSLFGLDFESPPKPYNHRSDFNGDGVVNLADFSAFGIHLYHEHPFVEGTLNYRVTRQSAATVILQFEESDPLVGEHRLRAHLSLDNAELFSAVLITLENENPVYDFVAWHPNPAYPQVTAGAKLVWGGRNVIMIGAMGSKSRESSYVNLGYFDVLVHADHPVEPTDADFVLLVGDVLDMDGGVLNMRGTSSRRTYSVPAYRNALGQNYPNPFNPTTTIAFSLQDRTHANLTIYDVRGARVRTLVDGEKERGNHRVHWDGVNNRGNRVASGVYFYRLTVGSFKATRKMVLLR